MTIGAAGCLVIREASWQPFESQVQLEKICWEVSWQPEGCWYQTYMPLPAVVHLSKVLNPTQCPVWQHLSKKNCTLYVCLSEGLGEKQKSNLRHLNHSVKARNFPPQYNLCCSLLSYHFSIQPRHELLDDSELLRKNTYETFSLAPATEDTLTFHTSSCDIWGRGMEARAWPSNHSNIVLLYIQPTFKQWNSNE